jgi:hypothetical protein
MFRKNITMEKVTLNQRDQNRLEVLNAIDRGTINIEQAEPVMPVPLLHTTKVIGRE